MPRSTSCPLYFDDRDVCSLRWWEDDRYDDECCVRPADYLRRCRSYDSSAFYEPKGREAKRDKHVKIYVNIRYKRTSNHDTLLSDEVCLEIDSRCTVMDVWQAAVECNRHLRHYEPTGKVLTTDSSKCYFTRIDSEAKIKNEYDRSERHWVFVIRPPFVCAEPQHKEKRKEKRKKKTCTNWFCPCH